MKKIALLLLACFGLSGCVGAFIAGAATTGMIVYDKRSLAGIANDQALRQQVGVKIQSTPALVKSNIGVSSFDGSILLVGETLKASNRVRAERLAYSIKGVKKVYNEITVGQPTGLKQRTKDAWLTTKVKSKLLSTLHLRSAQVKVVTENSEVFLLGRVTRSQAKLAVNSVREVPGVRRVVKAFEYES